MKSYPRGKAIILNNTVRREGSTADATRLQCVFKELGFHVEMWTDLTADVSLMFYISC